MPKPNIAFLNDLLQSIGSNVRRRPTRLAPASAEPAGARLAAACARLMRPSGEASRIAVAGAALDAFGALDDTGRRAFFHSLLDDYGADPAAIRGSEKVRHAYMGTAADTDLPVLEVME